MAIHQHDCDACISLGEFNGEDLYFHPGKHWTLISRYGIHGDYCSGGWLGMKNPQMIEARRRAVEAGYITADHLDGVVLIGAGLAQDNSVMVSNNFLTARYSAHILQM